MAQGKTKIKAKLPANAKHKSNKTNKKNSAFTKRKSKLSIVIGNQAFTNINFRCTRAKEDAGKVEDSSGDHKISQPKERGCNEIESN